MSDRISSPPVVQLKPAPPKRRRRRKKHNEAELINEILGKKEQRAEAELKLFIVNASKGYLQVTFTCETCGTCAVLVGATYSKKYCSYCQRPMTVETKKVVP